LRVKNCKKTADFSLPYDSFLESLGSLGLSISDTDELTELKLSFFILTYRAHFLPKIVRSPGNKGRFLCTLDEMDKVNSYRALDLSLKRTGAQEVCYPVWLKVTQRKNLKDRTIFHDYF